MLDRYSSEVMSSIWSDGRRYDRWREVELAVLAAQVRRGEAPPETLDEAERVPTPSAASVAETEAKVRHDVVAFLEAWTAEMSDRTASYVHRFLTSSDVVDTAQACALAAATDVIVLAARRLIVALADRALEHRETLCVARTHGQPAAFDVIGHRFADLAFAVDRATVRLVASRERVAVVNVSGPVGAGVGLPPELVADVGRALGLAVPAVTTQVIFRDSIAAWVADLAGLAAVCEAVANDIRLGQHDGVAEFAEPRGELQVGSSAMPHKRNPVTAEKVAGLARVLRGFVGPALENVTLWGHRDISHSSVERVVLPDSAAVCEHLLWATATMVEGLVVDVDAVRANIERAGAVLASSSLQAALQGDGVRRGVAASVVRDRLRDGSVSQDDVDRAANEVLESRSLAEVFVSVETLRAHAAAHTGN